MRVPSESIAFASLHPVRAPFWVPAPAPVGGPLLGPLDLHPTPYLPYPGRSERKLERLYLPYLRGGELRDSEAPHVAS